VYAGTGKRDQSDSIADLLLAVVTTSSMNTFRLFSRASFGRPFFSSFFRPSRGGTASQAFRSFHYFRPSLQRYRYVRFGDPPGRSSSGGLQTLWARLSPVQRIIVVGLGGGAPIFYVSHLETVPETGRRRFIFMSRSMEEAIGEMVTWLFKIY